MDIQTAQIAKQNKSRKNERGAALVTVLMITFLLLVAVTGLLLEASMNTANVTDAVAEDQAYYAAESGIQSVINILRGNTVLPDSLRIDTTKPATDPVNKIDYFKAVKLSTSNFTGDSTSEARLSRWMSYDSSSTDRVFLGPKELGFAYKIKVENPDNIGNVIVFNTSGNINKTGSTWTNGSITITYVPITLNRTLDVSSGSANTDFGSFVVAGAGTITTRVRFAINVNLVTPYSTTKVIRGHIEPGQIPSTSPANEVKITYDSEAFLVTGSTITLTGGGPIDPPVEDPPGSKIFRVGYVVPLNSITTISGSITAPEPIRLLIRSTGFGPRGAQKQLEAIILKNYFNGLSAPSPLTLIGPPSTSSPLPSTSFVFNPGTSTGTVYNGKDVHLKAFLPPIGVTNDTNLDTVNYELTHGPPNKYNGSIYGTASNVSDEMPFWLQSPTNLDKTLQQLKEVAKASGRYFPVGSTKPANGDYGNNANATGITYIEGNLEFSQLGGGILVVTGTLTFKGGFNFNGLIIVTGQGGINRTGGGSGVLQGNMVVAPYLPNDPSKGWLAPNYDISGGGASEIVYNSNNVANGLGALNNFVKGVAEK